MIIFTCNCAYFSGLLHVHKLVFCLQICFLFGFRHDARLLFFLNVIRLFEIYHSLHWGLAFRYSSIQCMVMLHLHTLSDACFAEDFVQFETTCGQTIPHISLSCNLAIDERPQLATLNLDVKSFWVNNRFMICREYFCLKNESLN